MSDLCEIDQDHSRSGLELVGSRDLECEIFPLGAGVSREPLFMTEDNITLNITGLLNAYI